MKKELINNIIEQVIEPFTCRILSIKESDILARDIDILMEDYEIQKKN
jgi:hypothetical protein